MGVRDRLKGKQGIVVILGIAGALLLFIGSLNSAENKDQVTIEFLYDEYEKTLENKLEEFCACVDGIDNVKAFVSLDISEETVYAQNSSVSSAQSTYEYLLFGADSALPIYEIMPKIRGVAIACDGGNDAYTQKVVTELISSALGIPTNKIKVVGYG
jgi:stage III sporulation protein AG